MPRLVVPAALALAAALSAQTALFPLKDLKPGMRGTGRTVFNGNNIEEFQVEILGVLDNIGPKESLILARLSGGPLEHTGVMQGMSGSPVYIDGKLVGAVAMAFPFAKDPIAGIRPIEDMLRTSTTAAPPSPSPAAAAAQRAALALNERDLTRGFPAPSPSSAGEARMIDIATPLSFGGFSRATLDAFAPQLRALGLEPRQGVTSGGKLEPAMGNPADLKPGSMISVQLMAGDLRRRRRRHRHPHRRQSHLRLRPPLPRYRLHRPALRARRSPHPACQHQHVVQNLHRQGVDGHHLPGPQHRRRRRTRQARRRWCRSPLTSLARRQAGRDLPDADGQRPLLSPLLLQMAVFTAIDATERTVGASSIRVTGQIEFQNAPAPLRINNMFAADNGTAMLASLSAAVPVAFVMQSGFDSLQLKKVSLNLEAFDQKKQLTIDGITASRREVRAGEKVQLNVSLTGENGAETVRHVDYQVPIGAEPGTLYFTVADANTANIADFRQVLTATARTPGATDLHGQQSAPQHQGLRPRLARRPGVPARRRRPARPAGLGRPDPRRLASQFRRNHPDPQLQNRAKWRSTSAIWP